MMLHMLVCMGEGIIGYINNLVLFIERKIMADKESCKEEENSHPSKSYFIVVCIIALCILL